MPLILTILVAAIIVAQSIYIVRATRSRISGKRARRALLIIDFAAIALMALTLLAPVIFIRSLSESAFYTLMKLLFISLATSFSVTIFVIFDLLASIPLRLKRKRRIKALTIAGAVCAAITFISAMWAMCINRFNIQVNQVEITIPDLPESFDGYTIAQISDLHVGTFRNDTTFVSRLVDRINSLNPDLVVFTGDIVNRHASEIEPFIPVLRRLHGHDGQFAILGNHDYADYYYAKDDTIAKERDRQHLRDCYASTSLTLLEDRSVVISNDNDSILLIGVGNIGSGRFPVYGSLRRAYPTPADSVVKILLSHDPGHWLNEIADNPQCNIALTLSGHTHAMQTMIFGFTPASFTSKTPAGLYSDKENARHLYVNIGAGTIGMPMRLGATPEITLIHLKR